MFHRFPPRQFLSLAALLLGSLACAVCQPLLALPEKDESKSLLRIICVSSLKEDQEVILASRDDEGKWQEYATFKLRSPLITDWFPAHPGELHLAVREADSLKSICHFTYPENTRRVLAVLLPDPVKKVYSVDVVDPGKLLFVKGSTLVVNYSRLPGIVALGSMKATVKSGERKVVKPVPEANGMCRMLVAYSGENKQLVPCYDRYVSSNQEARDMLFLLPDPATGLKVFSLSEFGPFE